MAWYSIKYFIKLFLFQHKKNCMVYPIPMRSIIFCIFLFVILWFSNFSIKLLQIICLCKYWNFFKYGLISYATPSDVDFEHVYVVFSILHIFSHTHLTSNWNIIFWSIQWANEHKSKIGCFNLCGISGFMYLLFMHFCIVHFE